MIRAIALIAGALVLMPGAVLIVGLGLWHHDPLLILPGLALY